MEGCGETEIRTWSCFPSPAPWLLRDKDATAESAGEETAFRAVKPVKVVVSGDLDPMDGEEDGDEEIADERGIPLDPVLRCKIGAERGMSNRTAAAGDGADTGLRPSSCGLWLLLRPVPAYVLPPGLPPGVIVLLVDVVTPVSNGESPLAEEGERGSTMARADADETSALDDVSGLVGWDNKNGPVAVSGRPSSLQSSKTESRLD